MPHPVPRKHHIVPAFYLAGFTPTDARNGKLYVFDHTTVKHYRTSPEKACRETDYNKIGAEGVPPYLIEDALAWHENVVAPHVRAVSHGKITDSRRHVGETLALAASVAVRSRRGRAQLEAGLAASLGMALRRGDVSAEKWERIRVSELRHGVPPELVPGYDDAMEKLRKGDWFPRAPAVVTRGFVPEAQDAVMKMLLNRHWQLAVTDADINGGFITSDSPLVWGDLGQMVVGRQQSLSSHDLEITFPSDARPHSSATRMHVMAPCKRRTRQSPTSTPERFTSLPGWYSTPMTISCSAARRVTYDTGRSTSLTNRTPADAAS